MPPMFAGPFGALGVCANAGESIKAAHNSAAKRSMVFIKWGLLFAVVGELISSRCSGCRGRCYGQRSLA